MSTAADYWEETERTELEIPGSRFGYMFGVGGFRDGPCAYDYDPWEHADMLDVPIVFRDDLPDPEMFAAYSTLIHRRDSVEPRFAFR